MDVCESGARTNLTASGLVRTGRGHMLGIFVSSMVVGATVKVYDGIDATGAVVVNTCQLAPGTSWLPMPFAFRVGLYIEITGTIDCQIAWKPA
jgi:hypothetical protein